MGLSISLRRVAIVLVWVLVVLTVAGIAAEYSRNLLGSKSLLIEFFSLTEEKNVPTWWSSFLLLACSIVLATIAATRNSAAGGFKRHWAILAVIFCYLSIDEFVEIHEWLTAVPGLGELHGPLYYGWVVPTAFLVAAFALSYLKFLFHLPMNTRIKVALAGALFVGGALGVELILGMWTEVHDEDNFVWAMIGLVQESMEIVGSSLFFYALLEYLGRTAPDLGITVRSGRDRVETTPMAAPRSGTPSWALFTWVKWSWLLVLAFIVAQSLTFHWRVLPTNSAGYFARGRADFLSGAYESAAENFTRSIERNPKDSDSYIYRGDCYAQQRQFRKAFQDIEKALQLRPDYEKSHAGNADVKALAWDTNGAREAYSRALELDPDYTRCYLQRGLAAYDAEEWNDAAADFRQVAKRRLTDHQITAQFFLWVARARAGEAYGATEELLEVMRVGRIRGDRFWAGAQFLTGQIAEPAYLAAMANSKGSDVEALKAEAFFLAGSRRLAFGDRAAALTLMRNTLATEEDEFYAYDRARVELETLLVGFHPMWSTRSGEGLEVASVTPGGPGEAAGLRPGFILSAINGVAAGQESFVEFIASAEPGSTVELQLKDGAGASVSLPLTLTPGSFAPTR